jgi:hypothetical protein
MSEVDAYQPALICVGILCAPLKSARTCMLSQLTKTIKKSQFTLALEYVKWGEFFENDGLFYDGKRFQIALFSPQTNVTVYVCNLADGWVSVYENLVKAGGYDAYFFRASLAEVAEYKVFEMKVWQHGILDRHVRAFEEENGWSFLNNGDPLPFEDIDRYKLRRISMRLDRKLIEGYSEAIGFGLNSVTKIATPCWHFRRIS